MDLQTAAPCRAAREIPATSPTKPLLHNVANATGIAPEAAGAVIEQLKTSVVSGSPVSLVSGNIGHHGRLPASRIIRRASEHPAPGGQYRGDVWEAAALPVEAWTITDTCLGRPTGTRVPDAGGATDRPRTST